MSQQIVHGHEIGHWVVAQTGGMYHERGSMAVGIVRDGKIKAGVILTEFNGKSCQIHVSGPAHDALPLVFHWAFDKLGVSKVLGFIDSSNVLACRLAKRIGAKQEAKIENASRDGDMLIYSVTREQCRYLESK